MRARRPIVLPVAVVAAFALAACTDTSPPDTGRPDPTATESPEPEPEPEVLVATLADPDDGAAVVGFSGPVRSAIGTSEALFDESPVAVVAPADDVAAQLTGASTAVALGVPMLLEVAGDTPADGGRLVSDELARLGVQAVLTVGDVSVDAGAAEVTGIPLGHEDPDELAELLGVDLEERPVADGEETAAVSELDPGQPTLLVPTGEPAAEPADGEGTEEPAEGAGAEEADGADGNGADGGPGEDAGEESDGEAGAEDRTEGDGTTDGTEGDDTAREGLGTRGTADGPVPLLELPATTGGGLVMLAGGPGDLAVAATARAAGWDVLPVPAGDPRVESVTVQAVAAADPQRVLAVGTAFGDAEDLEWKVRTAATGVELPGGGQTLFPGKRLIALYGTPSTAALGLLGEQDLDGSIRRAQDYANRYQALTEDVVVPAFEIIVTIASAGAGEDGQYSNRLPVESFVPWVEGAEAAGVYVVLDLQPGRTDFLTQAQEYEQLLLYPNVGLALDPEWRLLPDQVHLRQIGHVEIDEVNAVVEYLADLTRDNALPQKLLILHQFRLSMIRDRDRLDTSRDELAVMIHADGQGSQPAKQDTWRALRANAPEGVWWGWKNFIDEDEPMLTPEQTFGGVDPVPDFVSYQ